MAWAWPQLARIVLAALLALTLPVSVMTLGTGRTMVPQGVVHLVILAALFLAVMP